MHTGTKTSDSITWTKISWNVGSRWRAWCWSCTAVIWGWNTPNHIIVRARKDTKNHDIWWHWHSKNATTIHSLFLLKPWMKKYNGWTLFTEITSPIEPSNYWKPLTRVQILRWDICNYINGVVQLINQNEWTTMHVSISSLNWFNSLQ